jgi:CRP/FNR family transcriptional regulator
MVKPAPLTQSAPSASAQVVSIRELKATCATCSMRELCMPFGLDADELAQIEALVGSRKRIRKGQPLYQAGDPFEALYAVRVGSVKTVVLAEDGREQVTGYHMPGDIVGLEGMALERHTGSATALEDTDACVLASDTLETLAKRVPALQHNLRRFLAREITREQSVMLVLGSMRAEERLAAFLIDLAARYRQRGYSSTQFVLRMTREEIGSYLGLKLETVSRLFSRFQQEGVVRIQGREVTLLDPTALQQLCGQRD